SDFVYTSGIIMKPVFSQAKKIEPQHKRVIYAEGEDPRVLHAVRAAVEEGLARPILIGRPAVIARRIARAGLDLVETRDFEIVNTEDDPRYRELWQEYHQLMARDGVTEEIARAKMR